MFRFLCSLIIRFNTLRLVWKSLKALNQQSSHTRVEDVDFELLQLWCLLAFNSVLVSSGVETVLAYIIPLYYYFKMVLCMATFLPGTKVPNFLFEVCVVPAIEWLHTLLTTDLPSLLHFLKDELQILPLKLIDWLFLPGVFCLEFSSEDDNTNTCNGDSSYDVGDKTVDLVDCSEATNQENIRQTIPLPPHSDDFSTPPPSTTPPTTRAPLAPVKRKRHNNVGAIETLTGSLSPVRCSLLDHISASPSRSPISTLSRPLFHISPSKEDNDRENDGTSHIDKLYVESNATSRSVEEAIDAPDTDTVVIQDEDIHLSMENTAEISTDSYLENFGGNSDSMETVMSSCELLEDVEQIIEEHLYEPSRPTRRNRSSLTGHLRAILTGSSETSVREFYLDLHSPLSIQDTTTENAVSEEIELLHCSNDAEEDIPVHCTDPTESIIVHTSSTSTDEITAVVIPSNVPHVTTRKSLRLRKRLIYYR
jgi:hypothetical protein